MCRDVLKEKGIVGMSCSVRRMDASFNWRITNNFLCLDIHFSMHYVFLLKYRIERQKERQKDLHTYIQTDTQTDIFRATHTDTESTTSTNPVSIHNNEIFTQRQME